MAVAGIDPRPALPAQPEADVRPTVAVARSGTPIWVMAIGIGIVALILFTILESRRSAIAPAVRPRVGDADGTAAPPPPLFVPPPPSIVRSSPVVAPIVRPVPAPIVSEPAPPQVVYVPQPAPEQQAPPPQQQDVRVASDPALVFDNTVGDAPAASAATGGEGEGGQPSAPSAVAGTPSARATVLRNRPTTVPQGTLIPAVLESALDSTRPGLARALVSRDVVGFDGSRVLIQRGSRLIGEYRADLAPGQNRALVTWTRLVRPDGVTIAIGSPAADTLGRVGIRGKVNSHFFERFASAILQSSLEVGVNLASQIGNSGTIVTIPGGAVQSAGSDLVGGGRIAPTLRVKQGASITVFVARDLDFTSVESRR